MSSILKEKKIDFAVRIIKITKSLQGKQKERVLSEKLLHSGTAIGALISEAESGQGSAGFLQTKNSTLEEANETKYWLELLFATKCITK